MFVIVTNVWHTVRLSKRLSCEFANKNFQENNKMTLHYRLVSSLLLLNWLAVGLWALLPPAGQEHSSAPHTEKKKLLIKNDIIPFSVEIVKVYDLSGI